MKGSPAGAIKYNVLDTTCAYNKFKSHQILESRKVYWE